jgi:hypothetical protein
MRSPVADQEARQNNDQPVRREEVGAEMIAGGRVARLCPRRRWTSARRRRLHLVQNPRRRCCNSANRSFWILGATGCLVRVLCVWLFWLFVWVCRLGFLLELTCVVVLDFSMERGGFLYFFFLVVKSNDSKYSQ